mgnify:FL=1
MARLASVQVGGYYPTPSHLLKRIARPLRTGSESYPMVVVLDPCAGDGEAMLTVGANIEGRASVSYYGIELEQSRFKALKKRCHGVNVECLHGDAFRLPSSVIVPTGWRPYRGASVLYCNPPYDTHSVHGRLEQAFLERYTQFIAPNGVLVFVVPRASLAASAAHLATYFEEFSCYAFPSVDYAAFKQVVLYARRRAVPFSAPDERIAKRFNDIAGGATIAELPTEDGPVAKFYPVQGEAHGFEGFSLAPMDEVSLSAQYRLWGGTVRGKTAPLNGFGLELTPDTLYYQTYPVAQPMRPGHVAQALAAGIFNGREIAPNDPSSGLPLLYVKGNFKREYVTVESHKDKEGAPVKDVQVEVPRLEVVALNIPSGEYVSLASGTEPTGAQSIDKMNVADLVISYSTSLLQVLEKQCPPLQRRGDTTLPLPSLTRPLYHAQEDCARAALKLLQKGQNPFILGEIGSGKTAVSASIMEALAKGTEGLAVAKRALVVCPPHLLDGWREQLLAMLPGAGVCVLDTISDLSTLPAP